MRLPSIEVSELMVNHEGLSHYIQHYFGRPLEDILAPIGDSEVGDSVRHNGVYFQIKEARKEDDATLPQGVWTHELKTADWDQVENIAIEALCYKSKDLQLGVWLMESNINRYGIAGIAPAAVLIRALCETYWYNMHPQMLDGDIEFRTNPINWINEKLSLRLRLVPLTSTLLDGNEYSWDDWENAQRFEKLKMQNQGQIEWEGVNSEMFKQRLAATSKEFLFQLCEQIEDATTAISALIQWLDRQCGNNSPSLGEITGLLNNIRTMFESELSRRGVYLAAQNANGSDDSKASQDNGSGQGGHGGDDGPIGNGVIRSRADAFACLLEAAEFLMRDDPHSPVPYMVHTACRWGEKTAPDLYQELFLQKGGQLNIFEVMGLALNEKGSE
ncbi:hypothetical protein AB835_00500 [Candidatus Endobugula sertula]|uniref:ImpA N-terminal domain-containing protein n=1 Tax=Candidatus Endobugula sertula TaxID=62101 RepID=A0A1D2QU03_9GAMM|nr:hypothetical protein AB835_00500 [Candidatus Endobugula sertula]